MKIALVYDRVNKWGGAERVLLTLHEMFPEAPLYTSVYDPKSAPWAKIFPKVITSFLQKLPSILRRHEWLAPLMPLAFESFNFDEYDLVISLTSEAAKGIITKPKTKHVCYCLTPTRYLWSGYEDYFQNSALRLFSKPAISYLRFWDKVAVARPDVFIAISKEVQGRIKNYYGRKSEVIYPPIDSAFSSLAAQSNVPAKSDLAPSVQLKRQLNANILDAKRYFLVVSRLVPYKRVDIIIDAFNQLGWPLKVIGTGSELWRLKMTAKKNIEFLSNLTDRELLMYYKDCRALVFAGIEDFGLSLVEVQAVGRPVIAFKKGGALESVRPGRTGELFEPQTKEVLTRVLKDFSDKDYSQEECVKNAEKWSQEIFKRRFRQELEKYL